MSSSVTLSIVTNSVIAASKGFGWFVTGSPTLFAETIHSLADVGNQALLKVGEVRGKAGPDRVHPFGRGQEKFFWALVSAVSVFFVGCGINVYHGIGSLLHPQSVEPFSPQVIGLLLFALALESWTFVVAFRGDSFVGSPRRCAWGPRAAALLRCRDYADRRRHVDHCDQRGDRGPAARRRPAGDATSDTWGGR